MLLERSKAAAGCQDICVSLVGMSNIGKSRLAAQLPRQSWYRYSIDRRIAATYLRDEILDMARREMTRSPILASCLREGSIAPRLNVSSGCLGVLQAYLGKPGSAGDGALPMDEFLRRQRRHREAEIAATLELPAFVARARDVYGCANFVADTSGSLCEVVDPFDDDDPVIRMLRQHSIIVYIRPEPGQVEELVRRALKNPKPLYYRPEFLAEHPGGEERFRELLPCLFAERHRRYELLARHGYAISASDAERVRSEGELRELIADAMASGPPALPAPQGVAIARSAPRASAELMSVFDLYFGRGIHGGQTVSNEAWADFVAEEITPRFPDGLTVTDVLGQWRPDTGEPIQEPAKHVLLVLSGTAPEREKIEAIRSAYKARFKQQSVLLLERRDRPIY